MFSLLLYKIPKRTGVAGATPVPANASHPVSRFPATVVSARSAPDDDCPETAEKMQRKRLNRSAAAGKPPLDKVLICPLFPRKITRKQNLLLSYFVGAGACCVAHTGAS